jgi:zinc/manganese transport system substrate-binding protein
VVLASILAVATFALSDARQMTNPAGASTPRPIVAVGAENQYANVIAQIGGSRVTVTAIVSNPNTDPHTFEASPKVARTVGRAQLVVQNGLGYDAFMNDIENAASNPKRKTIEVQKLLKLPDSTPNPHLWYKPSTMPAVARAIARDLSSLDPSAAPYFSTRLVAFDRSLKPWINAMAYVKRHFPNAPVATTEPVGNYMLQSAGLSIKTPRTLQADVMNGIDPAPQNVAYQNDLLSQGKVKVFVYNQQVVDSLTESFLATAKSHKVPVVGVYETMPTPGFTYQSWMLAETDAVIRALSTKTSTQKL